MQSSAGDAQAGDKGRSGGKAADELLDGAGKEADKQDERQKGGDGANFLLHQREAKAHLQPACNAGDESGLGEDSWQTL